MPGSDARLEPAQDRPEAAAGATGTSAATLCHVVHRYRARDDRQQLLEHRRIDAALLRSLRRDVAALLLRSEDMTEDLVPRAAANQRAEDSAGAGASARESAAAGRPAQQPAEHSAQPAAMRASLGL